jgi:mRNA-degrading endonuclease RelE of RelBE toxin-antitoxin system
MAEYTITITEVAEAHLRSLPARDQRTPEAAIKSRLTHQPATPTRAIKKLRSNPFAEFELRVGDWRVLYNVEESEVVLLVIGRKVGNTLLVAGEEFHEHQDDPAEPPRSGSEGDAE